MKRKNALQVRYEVRTTGDAIHQWQTVAWFKNKALAVAEARSLCATCGEDYRVFKVTKAYTTEGDPHCASFKLE